MAKSKTRGQKPRNVLHIATQNTLKWKTEQKPVPTHLNKINIVNDGEVNRMNKAFGDIQKELAHFPKGLSLEPLQKPLIAQQCHENEPVTVDEAAKVTASCKTARTMQQIPPRTNT
ncbi:ribosomal biogenesis factor-like [Sorex fumeus]|uniref:ribosomal biogenesis factor-like n=1 Tax=Sorex fumeus TaxID=62283 RepID=UPI0024ACA74A|nr:ribosomal biogenesis factor-like [Sorex fumeus]